MKVDSLNGKYMIRPRINTLLDKSINYKISFISADIGWGKTISVSQWAKETILPIKWFDSKEDEGIHILKQLRQIDGTEIISIIIVIDNFHLLIGTEGYNLIIEFIKNSKLSWKFIIMSRSVVPDEFKPYADDFQLAIITENDLALTAAEIKDYFLNYNYLPDDESLMRICKETKGYILALNILRYTVKLSDGNFGAEGFAIYEEELFAYYDRNIYNNWTLNERQLFLALSLLHDFSTELASTVTGLDESKEIIIKYSKKEKFITRIQPDIYRLNSFLLKYLEHLRKSMMSPEETNKILQKAGAWYEDAKEMEKAFDCYHRIGSYEEMMELLVKSSENYLYTVNFDKLEQFYKVLPPDIIDKSPALCSNMVFLHAICYRKEETEEWYKRLLSIRDSIPVSDAAKRKNLEERIIYTFLVLPDTNDIKLIKILRNMIDMDFMNSPLMQRITLTGNMPSILRGYKDFSRWSNRAEEMRIHMGPIIETLFIDLAAGVINISIAETLYEKNQLNAALVEVTKGINQIEQRGSAEMMYTGYTLLARIMAAYGQVHTSQTILENVSEKISNLKAHRLIPNYRATVARFDMLSEKIEYTMEWLKEYSPDFKAGFRIFDCYQYLTKAKAYLQAGMYPQAIADLERLYSFYTDYKRPLDLIEDLVLQAIAFDRIGEEELSLNRMEEALKIAQKHSFIRVFADEGNACYKVLVKYSRLRSSAIRESFLRKVSEAAKQYALMYPNYLMIMQAEEVKITKAETEVLQLLERGMSNGEIAEFLVISMDTVKFHTKNIYSKLNVKSRMQAVILAKKLKIL